MSMVWQLVRCWPSELWLSHNVWEIAWGSFRYHNNALRHAFQPLGRVLEPQSGCMMRKMAMGKYCAESRQRLPGRVQFG